MTKPRITCLDCLYAIEERAAIHQYEGKAPRHIADARAAAGVMTMVARCCAEMLLQVADAFLEAAHVIEELGHLHLDEAGLLIPDESDEESSGAVREDEVEKFREFLDQINPEDFAG